MELFVNNSIYIILDFYFNEMVYNITLSMGMHLNIYGAKMCEPPLIYILVGVGS